MGFGVIVRNQGPQSSRETFTRCALAAEAAGLDDIWVHDHIAIPPDDAEGSGGRYLDPLAALAFVAGKTERIGLGTAVLVLPYRPALPTAKWIATVQELSGHRLKLGVGVGAMAAEFRALGVEKAQRGRLADTTLAFLEQCFTDDEVVANGQPFLFRPRPRRPPIYVGGSTPQALQRVVRYGDGWLPTVRDLGELASTIERLRSLARDSGRAMPDILAIRRFPLEDPAKALAERDRLAALGVTSYIHRPIYDDADEFQRSIDILARTFLV